MDTRLPDVAHRPPRDTILVVEDDASVLFLVQRILERAGYGVLAASSAEEALLIVTGASEPPQLLLSDVIMPGMGFRDYCEQLAEAVPNVPLLLMSGHTDRSLIQQLGEVPHLDLRKPFTPRELLRTIRVALATSPAGADANGTGGVRWESGSGGVVGGRGRAYGEAQQEDPDVERGDPEDQEEQRVR
jgi:CheY-like chemotaxis protein